MLVLLLDLLQEPPARSAVRDVVVDGTALIVARVELADDVSLAVPHVPNERPRVAFGREGLVRLVVAGVVDGELDGFDANRVLSEGLEAGVTTDSEIGRVPVLADHQAALAFAIEFGRDGEVFLGSAAVDAKLPVVGILERRRTPRNRIEHFHKLQRRVLGA